MTLQEIKDWIEKLPPEFLTYDVFNGEVGILDGDYWFRVDKPLTTLTVDEKTKEIIFLNDTEKTDITEDQEADAIVAAIDSQEFRSHFKKQIEEDTWGNDVPMYYVDDDGWLIEHNKDGTKVQVKRLFDQI